MKVFSFLSIKGGVGKTTLVSNLATELAIRGKKVLLIDLDLQANLSMAFFDPEEYMQHVSEGRTIRGFYPNGILENLFEKKEIKLKDLILSPRLVNESMDIFSGSNSCLQKLHLNFPVFAFTEISVAPHIGHLF